MHKYYDVRRRAMKLTDAIHAYDTYVPILSDLDRRHTWDQAVDAVVRVARARSARTTPASCGGA